METQSRIIHSKDLESLDRGAIDVKPVVDGMMTSEDVSITEITVHGKNVKTAKSIGYSYYFVWEGEGFFTINGERSVVEKGDHVIILPGDQYFDEVEDGKTMQLIAVCAPHFNEKNIIRFD